MRGKGGMLPAPTLAALPVTPDTTGGIPPPGEAYGVVVELLSHDDARPKRVPAASISCQGVQLAVLGQGLWGATNNPKDFPCLINRQCAGASLVVLVGLQGRHTG